ncbi:MAG: histidine--tRNA ligase [Deltaproteobacteria bacterium]|nr:histidine--tRNA ligase [Deltaproteobacteria bacterium]
MKIAAVKGMHDLLPPESAQWIRVEALARQIFGAYGYAEIRTPIVEKTSLFVRSVGEESDLVEKEMYTFLDQGDESLTLRPEGTAPVVRALIEHDCVQHEGEAKFFYLGPMFRRERPQKGRYRQFHQIGVEYVGASHPYADAEVITMMVRFFEALGIAEWRLEINTLGCRHCRPIYQGRLSAFLRDRTTQLCPDCQRRLHKNPLRVFDCKRESCQRVLADAPTIADDLCEACELHFQRVCHALELHHVTYWVNHRIARGLDYYTRTAFEIVTQALGAQNAIGGGGRYDGLVKTLDGPDLPGIGCAIGMERLCMLLAQQGKVAPESSPRIFVAALGDVARDLALPIMDALRARAIPVEWDVENRSLKAQMKRADRWQATYTVILGDHECASGEAIVRDMGTKAQTMVSLSSLVSYFAERVTVHTAVS